MMWFCNSFKIAYYWHGSAYIALDEICMNKKIEYHNNVFATILIGVDMKARVSQWRKCIQNLYTCNQNNVQSITYE